ncbi:hypothetical protein [Hoeflea prorocentri]|uniref:Uncharacterized protein n=1 Tax=Hoeflea prorocentri TaxID=1922333 RepID=A0A9X3ZFJ2_9HYPH|nr:hypothetical protein [Hoeflea prorocentri]MCY6379752.1 hypothetical protein [Hoeflea prorocentri]MDA5397552.1 hypothetical protein [Hoeflea prorocentri]
MVETMRPCDDTLNNADMHNALLALSVIPEIRVSNSGPFDLMKFERIGVFVS